MNPEKDRPMYRHEPNRPPFPEPEPRPRPYEADQPVWSSDDDYVDWSKHGRIAVPSNSRKKALSFVVPFVAAFLVFMFFDHLLKDKNSVKPVSPKEFAARNHPQKEAETPELPEVRPAVVQDAQSNETPTVAPVASDAPETPSAPPETSPLEDVQDPLAEAQPPLPDASETSEEPATLSVPNEPLSNADVETPLVEEEPDLKLTDDAQDNLTFDDEPFDVDAVKTEEETVPETGETPVEPVAELLSSDSADVDSSQSLAVESDERELQNDPFEPDVEPLTNEPIDDLVAFDDEHSLDAVQEPEVDVEAVRSELASIEYLFNQLRSGDARDVDDDLDALDEPISQARQLLENAPAELAEPGAALLRQMEDFQNSLSENVDFYRTLETLDAASLDAKKTREFFEPWRDGTKESSDAAANADKSEIVRAYDAELARAAESLDALDVVDRWNAFMQENGERLERFHASQEDAKLALGFLDELSAEPGVPEEIKLVEKKQDQWRFDAEHDFPTQRKIVLMLESELHQKYWTYAPSRNKVYYLPAEPRVGENVYVANSQGEVAKVRIPANAPELGQKVSPQKQFLEELVKKAWDVPDSLRNEDVAQWYSRWSDFLKSLQETKEIDPILQYKFFKEAAVYLQQSDYFFSSRLEPLMRVLNAPQLDEQTTIDRFQTEKTSLVNLRDLAISRVDFLPKDHLNVDKTTEELNARVARFATLYRRVGWLDKSFNDEWRLRRPKDAEIPEGDLYVVYAQTPGTEPKWFKVGSADGRQITLNVASDSIPRGSIVLCRVPLTKGSTVASRSAVDALFKR